MLIYPHGPASGTIPRVGSFFDSGTATGTKMRDKNLARGQLGTAAMGQGLLFQCDVPRW